MDKKSAFFIILSIVILAVMLYFIGIDKVIDALENANLAIMALAVLFQIFSYFLYTLGGKSSITLQILMSSSKVFFRLSWLGLLLTTSLHQAVVVENR